MNEQGHVTIRKVPAGWERAAFIAWLQSGPDVIVTDMTDCPSGVPTNVIVKRASGEVAGWSMTTFGEAVRFARECNELVPGNPAHVVAWDDSVWDDVLSAGAPESSEGQA
jgi:hypothetical protein